MESGDLKAILLSPECSLYPTRGEENSRREERMIIYLIRALRGENQTQSEEMQGSCYFFNMVSNQLTAY